MPTYRVCCISDMHGYYPSVPPCDLLLLGGDYCRGGDHFAKLKNHADLCYWINRAARNTKVVGIAGNHDILFEEVGYKNLKQANWTYLQDSGCEWNGLKIWGTPWQPRFFDWAFNLDEPELEKRWAMIPEDTDILIVHGPPHGVADLSNYKNEHTGSPSLLQRIKEIKPQLVVCGHIHEQNGVYQIGETTLVSSSIVDDRYNYAYAPRMIEVHV